VAVLGVLAILALLTGGGAAHADFILDPATASTSMGTGFGSPNNVINQSGLSTTYTSLVTNFASYIASNPTHNSILNANDWISPFGTPTGNFDFGLGGTFTIDSFALWNFPTPAGVVGFQLLASADSSFSSTTSLGTFTAHPNNVGLATAVQPEVFTFAPTSAAFVRMVITSNNGDLNTGFGEAAFSVQATATATPEPASVTLAVLGALGLAGYGWRKRGMMMTGGRPA
jgi:hypothetical protein